MPTGYFSRLGQRHFCHTSPLAISFTALIFSPPYGNAEVWLGKARFGKFPIPYFKKHGSFKCPQGVIGCSKDGDTMGKDFCQFQSTTGKKRLWQICAKVTGIENAPLLRWINIYVLHTFMGLCVHMGDLVPFMKDTDLKYTWSCFIPTFQYWLVDVSLLASDIQWKGGK